MNFLMTCPCFLQHSFKVFSTIQSEVWFFLQFNQELLYCVLRATLLFTRSTTMLVKQSFSTQDKPNLARTSIVYRELFYCLLRTTLLFTRNTTHQSTRVFLKFTQDHCTLYKNYWTDVFLERGGGGWLGVQAPILKLIVLFRSASKVKSSQ